MSTPSPRHDTRELTDELTRQTAVERLQTHLGLDVTGTKATTEMVFNVLLHAASTGQSVEASCEELVESADSNTIRDYLNDYFTVDNLEEIESQINSCLTTEIPRKARRGKQDVCIDLHDQPFYGKDVELNKYACRGEAKSGTTHFFRVATLYLIHNNIRLTLGIIFVLKDTDLLSIVVNLLKDLNCKKIRLGRLYLDRGFASTAIYKFLVKEKYSAIIACPIKGKLTGKGTKSLCKGRKSYFTSHTFKSQTHGSCTVKLAMIRYFVKSTKTEKRSLDWAAFVLINTKPPLNKIFLLYRHRFGIESSYRLMRQLRIPTNSRNPMIRFIYMSLGFILVNVWLLLKFLYTQLPKRGRGGRSLNHALFRLKCFASFIRHAVERIYSFKTSIVASHLPIGVVS